MKNEKLKMLGWVRAILLASTFSLSAADLKLAWDASETPGVESYILLATNVAGASVRAVVGTNLTASVEQLAPGDWSFTVSAVKGGIQSDPSDVLKVEVPQRPKNFRLRLP